MKENGLFWPLIKEGVEDVHIAIPRDKHSTNSDIPVIVTWHSCGVNVFQLAVSFRDIISF